MIKILGLIVGVVGLLSFAACKKKAVQEQAAPQAATSPATNGEPAHIKVQHILIGFTGRLPGKNITRSQKDAEKLAQDILEKAKKAPDSFEALVKEYTDDSPPGIYGMSNFGQAPEGEEYPRDQMVPAFGNVGFKLQVGEIGMASFDEATSPYGYHIIKRLN